MRRPGGARGCLAPLALPPLSGAGDGPSVPAPPGLAARGVSRGLLAAPREGLGGRARRKEPRGAAVRAVGAAGARAGGAAAAARGP